MNKTCPYCAEEIKQTAKVCPRCRNWLTMYSLRNPALQFIVMVLLFSVVFSGLFITIFRITNPGRNFSPYRDSLSVVESHMNFSSDKDGPAIYVVVVITNKCQLAWKNPQLDLKFYDRAGALIDATPSSTWGTIYPNGERAMRVKKYPSRPIEDYAKCEVFVRWAVESNVLFE